MMYSDLQSRYDQIQQNINTFTPSKMIDTSNRPVYILKYYGYEIKLKQGLKSKWITEENNETKRLRWAS